MEKINYFKKSWRLLLKSFKDLDSRALFIFLYDFLFFFIASLSVFIFSKLVQSNLIKITALPMDKLLELPGPELQNILAELKGTLFLLIGGFFIVALIIFIAISIFKCLVWFITSNKKCDLEHIFKFTLLNLIWFAMWIIPALILIFTLRKELIPFIVVITLLGLIHFTNILYILFVHESHIRTIKHAFSLGIKKIYLFIIPYIFSLIILIVLNLVYWLYQNIDATKINFVAYFMLISLPILLYMIWSRNYLRLVVEDIKNSSK